MEKEFTLTEQDRLSLENFLACNGCLPMPSQPVKRLSKKVIKRSKRLKELRSLDQGTLLLMVLKSEGFALCKEDQELLKNHEKINKMTRRMSAAPGTENNHKQTITGNK
jgi:hypothetical protein